MGATAAARAAAAGKGGLGREIESEDRSALLILLLLIIVLYECMIERYSESKCEKKDIKIIGIHFSNCTFSVSFCKATALK